MQRANFLNQLRLKREAAFDTRRIIVVQTTVGTGEEMNFFAQINNVCRKSSHREQKDKQKEGFPSMKRTKKIHKYVSS